MPLQRQTTANGKCQAKTKAGRQCRAPAVRDRIYCALHADPERAAQLGRKGGIGNRKLYEANHPKISAPRNASDVMNLLADAMAEVRAGRMDPKVGSTLGYLGTSLMKVIEVADVDDRLKRLELIFDLDDATRVARERDLASRDWEEPS